MKKLGLLLTLSILLTGCANSEQKAEVATSTTVEINVDLSKFAGQYVTSEGDTITISNQGEFIVGSKKYNVDKKMGPYGVVMITPSEWTETYKAPVYNLDKDRITVTFRGRSAEYIKK